MRYFHRFYPGHLKVRFVFVVLVLSAAGFFQNIAGQCFNEKVVFQPGEEVHYDAYYNWGFVWINAGRVTFAVKEDQWNNRPVWQFQAHGNTRKAYDVFFKVRDSFEVWVDPHSLKPLEFHRRTYEGSYRAHFHYLFDDEDREVNASISKREQPYRDTVFTWPRCTYDILSMVYQARNIDFSKYQRDEKIPINMIVDGEVYNLYIRYLGRETIKDPSGREFRCLKFSPLLVEGTIFEKGEDMTVWVTDDQSRIPIIVEAKILVGSVKAVFTGAEGLKYPLSAEVED